VNVGRVGKVRLSVTAALLGLAAVLLVTGFATHELPLAMASVLCTMMAAFSLIWYCVAYPRFRLDGERHHDGRGHPEAGQNAFRAVSARHTATGGLPKAGQETFRAVSARHTPDDRAFPIDDYDMLRVDAVLPLLPGLDAKALGTVRRHEEAGRARRIILRQIESLAGVQQVEASEPTFPIDDYDQMRVVDILPLLTRLSPTELDSVAAHELATGGRRTILTRIARIQERHQRSTRSSLPPSA
jgi:hypothetical protein